MVVDVIFYLVFLFFIGFFLVIGLFFVIGLLDLLKFFGEFIAREDA